MTANYLDAIRKFEGFTPKAEWDYAQFTNGYGTKAKFAGEVIDQAEADRRFRAEVAEARAIVERHAPDATEGTKAALTSLTYNAGDKWTRSGLGEAVRNGDTERAREIFLQYNKAGGEVLPGLAHRRVAEAAWIGQQGGTMGADMPTGATSSAGPVMAAAVGRPVFSPETMSFLGAGRGFQPPRPVGMDATPPAFPDFSVRQTPAERADQSLENTQTAQAETKTEAEIDDELLSQIRGAVSGFGGEARMAQLLLASKLIGAPSSTDSKSSDGRTDETSKSSIG
jgi:lysozyme